MTMNTRLGTVLAGLFLISASAASAQGFDEAPAQLGFVSASLAYSQERGPIVGIGANLQDLFGSDTDFSMSAQKDDDGYRLGAKLSSGQTINVPYFNVPGTLSFSYHSDVNEWEESAFSTRRNGIATDLFFGTGAQAGAKVGLFAYQEDIYDVDAATFELVAATAGVKTAVGVDLGWHFDSTDNVFAPHSGLATGLNFRTAGLGGDSKWFNIAGSASYYQPISDNVTLKLFGTAGQARALDGDTLRITERAFLGGDLPRGFAHGGIGPRFVSGTTDLALGGENYAAFTTEVAFDVAQLGNNTLRGIVFADAGSVWGLEDTVYSGGEIDDSLFWRSSAGVGISLVTQSGAFEILYANPIKKRDGDHVENLSLSVRLDF